MSRLSVILVLTAFAVNAATFYVAPNGSADADCLSPATAGTIAAAYELVASASSAENGDEIILLPGDYDGSSSGGHLPLTITKNFLTIRSSTGLPETTKIIGPGSAVNLSAFTVSTSSGAPNFEGITFTNFFNTAANKAGVLNGTSAASSTLENCILIGNKGNWGSVSYGLLKNCKLIANLGTHNAVTRFSNCYDCYFEGNEGGYASYDGDEFFNCIYTNNLTGAIWGKTTAIISNCTFIANHARNGAGVRNAKAIYDCTFITNTITHDGCAVYGSSDGSTKIYNSYFYGNVAPQGGSATYNCSAYNSKFVSNIGRACYIGSVFENCYFTNNPSGAIQGAANSIVSNCLFIANRAKWGGAIHTAKAIYDCVFVTNWATGKGGAVYNGNEAYRSFFTNNHCNAGDRQGGATYSTSCFDSTFNSNISGNGGACNGGAYFINCYYTNNIGSGGSGGAIWTSNTAIISNCYFVANSCSSYGGATYNGNVYDSTYITNTGRYGGATYQGSVDRCYFYGNVGTTYAGGTHYTDSRNSIYIGNSSPVGGGADEGSFYNCYFRDNSSPSGGGIVVSAPAYLTNNIFINNQSTHGAAVNTGSGANIVNCIFIRNKSSESGGIIGGKYTETTWKGTFINCLMAENSSGSYSPMYGRLVTGDSVFINCTIISNQCNASGKRWAPASGVFTNTLFHGNANFDIEKGELVNCLFGTVNMSNVTTNNACIVLANPLFNPKKNLDHPFYLHKSSPAIDAGIIVPELLCTNIVDLGGTRRIKGRAVDIGAYETLGPGTLFGVY